MTGVTSSTKGILTDLLAPILLKIGREPTREGVINLHWLVSGNAASVLSNLGGGHHGHLALTMTKLEYTAETDFSFVPLHNPGNYPPTITNAQEQALRTEKIWENKALVRKFTAVDRALKTKSSRNWNQSSCPRWWNIWQDLNRCCILPCYSIYYWATGWWKKLIKNKIP